MGPPVRDYDLIREMKNAFIHRLRQVTYARQCETKAAARAFHTTVWSARKCLRRDFDLPVSPGTAYRLWRTPDLGKPRRRKYQKKQDLAALKAPWARFPQLSSDTKDLDDIPPFGGQMPGRGLPAIQYTARELRSGLQFLAFAERRSVGAGALRLM